MAIIKERIVDVWASPTNQRQMYLLSQSKEKFTISTLAFQRYYLDWLNRSLFVLYNTANPKASPLLTKG